ncbi:DNA-damage-inducible protein J [Leptogranulimonas caecicola]|uniref:DNA-damage-inducible protein J n=2 Tax=Leptogranulimonas caecicola TaxID=2894156 RepID=A0AAU9CRT8_9ACTN|nr:DNA-damage-inducible protein J [Leptogranulimonas caecicola]
MVGEEMATTNVTIRMDEDLKRQADELFAEMGMSFTTAVNVFTRQAIRERRIPFDIFVGSPSASVDRDAVEAALSFSSDYLEDFKRMAK